MSDEDDWMKLADQDVDAIDVKKGNDEEKEVDFIDKPKETAAQTKAKNEEKVPYPDYLLLISSSGSEEKPRS